MKNKNKPLDYKDYPTISEVKSLLSKIESKTWEGWREDETFAQFDHRINHELTKDLKIFPTAFRPFNGAMPLPFRFFRVRTWSEINNPELITHHSYPPPSFVSPGRANLKNHPVFYAADDPHTAILEVIMKNGRVDFKQELCLTSWFVPERQQCILAPFVYEGLDQAHPFAVFSTIDIEEYQKICNNDLREEQIEGIFELHKFYTRIFLRDESGAWVISSYLAHKHLYSDPEMRYSADIFFYPSLCTNKTTINYAVSPNFVDNRMSFRVAYKITIREVFFNVNKTRIVGLSFKINDYGIKKGDSISWKKFEPKNETEIKKLFELDFPESSIIFD